MSNKPGVQVQSDHATKELRCPGGLHSTGDDVSGCAVPAGGLFDENPIRARVLDAALHTAPRTLADRLSAEPGAYLHIYRGSLPLYERVGVREREASTLALSHGWPIYAGSSRSLSERNRSHRGNFVDVRDFDSDDFLVVALPCHSLAGALMAERIFIETFRPVFNQPWLGGVASRPQGASREHTQATAPFSVLHPGRRACSGATKVTAAGLADRVRQHLITTVPDWWIGGKQADTDVS